MDRQQLHVVQCIKLGIGCAGDERLTYIHYTFASHFWSAMRRLPMWGAMIPIFASISDQVYSN